MAVWLAKLTLGFTIPFIFDTYLACVTSVPVRTAFNSVILAARKLQKP